MQLTRVCCSHLFLGHRSNNLFLDDRCTQASSTSLTSHKAIAVLTSCAGYCFAALLVHACWPRRRDAQHMAIQSGADKLAPADVYANKWLVVVSSCVRTAASKHRCIMRWVKMPSASVQSSSWCSWYRGTLVSLTHCRWWFDSPLVRR